MPSSKLILSALAAAALALLAPVPQASAQRSGWSRTYETPGPQRGYEGWAAGGRRTYYCSYWRVPNRTCDRKGCRVTSWSMTQHCG